MPNDVSCNFVRICTGIFNYARVLPTKKVYYSSHNFLVRVHGEQRMKP